MSNKDSKMNSSAMIAVAMAKLEAADKAAPKPPADSYVDGKDPMAHVEVHGLEAVPLARDSLSVAEMIALDLRAKFAHDDPTMRVMLCDLSNPADVELGSYHDAMVSAFLLRQTIQACGLDPYTEPSDGSPGEKAWRDYHDSLYTAHRLRSTAP